MLITQRSYDNFNVAFGCDNDSYHDIRKYRKAPGEIYTPSGFKVLNGWAFVSAPDPGDPEVDTMAFDVLLQKTGRTWKVVDQVSHVEGTNYDNEIKRIRKKFPKAPAEIFQ